jgi:Fibronectin type III domain
MAGTLDLPAIGRVKTGYVIGGGAVVLGIVGIAWYRHEKNAAASSAGNTAAAASSTPIDPETGYPEGSPEDEAALAQLNSGYYGSSEEEGTIAGSGGQALYYDPADGLYDLTSPYEGTAGTATSSASANTGPGTFTSNAYWVQYAIENVQGYSATDIQGALSAYLAGLGLTTTQMSIYQAALAVAGPAPDPPSTAAHLATQSATGSTSSSGTASSSGGDITVAPGGFHVVSVKGSSVTLAWDKLTPPAGEGPVTGYVIAYGPTSGSQAYRSTAAADATQITIAGVGGGAAGSHYFELWALPAASGGPHAGPIEATTTKS